MGTTRIQMLLVVRLLPTLTMPWPRALCFAVVAAALVFAGIPAHAAERANLALHKPASSSSIENDEHSAARANDGDPDTSWCADDEPEGGPEWWQVDLEKTCDLAACHIRWPFAGKHYRYKVEGSTDRKTWSLLSDQTKSTSTSQVHKLKFAKAARARYVRITITGFDDGLWASIAEVKIFGNEASANEKSTAQHSKAATHSTGENK